MYVRLQRSLKLVCHEAEQEQPWRQFDSCSATSLLVRSFGTVNDIWGDRKSHITTVWNNKHDD